MQQKIMTTCILYLLLYKQTMNIALEVGNVEVYMG